MMNKYFLYYLKALRFFVVHLIDVMRQIDKIECLDMESITFNRKYKCVIFNDKHQIVG